MNRPIGWNKPEGKELIEGFDTPQLSCEDALIRIHLPSAEAVIC